MARRVPFTGGEKESLQISLDRHRKLIDGASGDHDRSG